MSDGKTSINVIIIRAGCLGSRQCGVEVQPDSSQPHCEVGKSARDQTCRLPLVAARRLLQVVQGRK